MDELNGILKAIVSAVAAVAGLILGVLLLIYVVVGAGYFLGMVIAILPFVSGWLTASLPITTSQIPGIVAWIAVFGLFVSKGGDRRITIGRR